MDSSRQVHKILYLPLLLFLLFCSRDAVAQESDSLKISWLKVVTNLDQYYLVVDDDYQHPHLVTRDDSIQVEPGERKITVVWKDVNDFSFRVQIQPNQIHVESITFATFPDEPRSSYKVITNEPNLKIRTDQNSSIYLDGEFIGKHTAEVIALTGEHKLVIKHPEFGSLTKNIQTRIYENTTIARYNENPSDLPFAAKLLPGAGYVSTNRYRKAAVTYGLLGALTSALIINQSSYAKKQNELKKWERLYNDAQTTDEAIDYRLKAENSRQNLSEIGENFNTYLLITSAVYLISTLDGFRKPRDGYRSAPDFPKPAASISALSVGDAFSPVLTLKFSLK